jgi:hypothetical protein
MQLYEHLGKYQLTIMSHLIFSVRDSVFSSKNFIIKNITKKTGYLPKVSLNKASNGINKLRCKNIAVI